MKHTPGPWVYSPERNTGDCIIHTVEAPKRNETKMYNYIGLEWGGVLGSSEWIWIRDADARLITLAPDMYQLVGEVLLWAKTTGDYSMNPYCENFVRLAVKIEETLNNA